MSSEPTAIRLPSRQLLTDGVYEAVKEQIMDQHIEPGAQVNIDQLARQLAVSSTPVREALVRLESDGLVSKQPMRGYTIAPLLDAASFEHLYDVRLLLEPHAAGKAALFATKQDLNALEHANEQMQLAMRDLGEGRTYREYRLFATYDAKYHERILRASANQLLYEAVVRLHMHLQLHRLYFHTGIADRTIPEHQEILAAIRAQDPDAAMSAMAIHVEMSRGRVRAAFRARTE